MHRHYSPVKEYVKLAEEGKVARWEDKKPALIWRGGLTGTLASTPKAALSAHIEGGPRAHVVKRYFHADSSVVDVAFQRGSPTLGWNTYDQTLRKLARDAHTSMEDQLRFKYVLMLEGNDVATGLKWELASNSVVFMARPTTVSYLMEDLLVPFVHYVPLKDDYSDIVEMVMWARENDSKCEWIATQATLFMERLFLSKEAKAEHAAVKEELGERYSRQFGEAVKSCAKSKRALH